MTGRTNPWTPEQLALLQKLRADGVDWPEVSARCGHSEGSCATTLSMLQRRQARIAAGELPADKAAFSKGHPKNPKRFWTEADVQTLIPMVTVEGKTCVDVDHVLGRSEGASAEKFNRLRRPEATTGFEVRKIHAPKALPQHTSLTAEFFGDPLPGRSALDQRARQGDGVRSVSLATGPMQ
jgi:hypothetical protein